MSKLIHPQDYIDMDVAPAIEAKVEATMAKLAESSRRSFMGRGLAAAGAGAALGLGSTARAASSSTSGTTTTSGSTTTATYQTGTLLHEVAFDEASHVNILASAIRLLGGTPRPYPTFTSALTSASRADFFQKAVVFENTGVSAYFGASAYISNKTVLGIASSIALVEGLHSGFFNTVTGGSLVPNGIPYAQALTAAQVSAITAPFIASLNDNGMFPGTYSTTPSGGNDIAILNFALITELLEATFYAINVPKYF